MNIVDTMKRFPGGMMVVPLILGTLINTFIPQVLEIGGFTTALFKGGQATLVGLFIFCSGATIRIDKLGIPLYKGTILTLLKLIMGVLVGYIVNILVGPSGILGLTPFAIIAGMTNSNGAIYATLAQEMGDETDIGAIAILSLNDGPFLTMIALGTTGLASIPIMALVAAILPLLIGMILGNLDPKFRSIMENGLEMILPINGFVFGANMNLITIVEAGIPGILLGAITIVFTGIFTYYLYSRIMKKPSPMGMAIGTVAGNALATPAAVALADPTLEPLVAPATAQIAAAIVITAIITPMLTGYYYRKSVK